MARPIHNYDGPNLMIRNGCSRIQNYMNIHQQILNHINMNQRSPTPNFQIQPNSNPEANGARKCNLLYPVQNELE